MAGLCAARLLASQAHDVVVIEKRSRESSAQEIGREINLTLTARGRHILQELGLLNQVVASGAVLSHREAHYQWRTTITQPYGPVESGWLLSVKRADLHAILLQGLDQYGVDLRFETTLVGCDLVSNTATISRTTGLEQLCYHLMVGADGVSSTVRQTIISKRVRSRQKIFLWKYTNFHISEATAKDLRLNLDHLHLWFAEDSLGVGIPNRDGSISAILVFRTQESRDDRVALAWAARNIRDHYPELESSLQAQLNGRESLIGRLTELSLSRWWRNQVVLIGDACHAMYPFCGLGLNTALEDAYELARQIAERKSTDHALMRYDKIRRPVVGRAQAQSRAQFDFLYGLAEPGSALGYLQSRGIDLNAVVDPAEQHRDIREP